MWLFCHFLILNLSGELMDSYNIFIMQKLCIGVFVIYIFMCMYVYIYVYFVIVKEEMFTYIC